MKAIWVLSTIIEGQDNETKKKYFYTKIYNHLTGPPKTKQSGIIGWIYLIYVVGAPKESYERCLCVNEDCQ